MSAPQGLAHFPGIAQVLSGQFTLTEGISPSIATLNIVPQLTFTIPHGELAFTYGSRVIRFPGAYLNLGIQRGSQRGWVRRVSILDRRWRWADQVVTGRYNIYQPDGSILPGTERTPQELAVILLRAMGESSFSVSDLPNRARPEVDWQPYRNPAEELQKLADAGGCRICYGPDNRVRLRLKGRGIVLPTTQLLRTGIGINLPIIPGSILLIGGRSLYQCRLGLEAVGLDLDGTVRPINHLSYRPPRGWEREFPGFFGGVANIAARVLALKTVFRWYRVVDARDIAAQVPVPLRVLNQILPLLNHKATSHVDGEGVERFDAPEIRGRYYRGGIRLVNTAPNTPYDGEFQIQADRGIVQLADPVYKLGAGVRNFPADLTLETAFSVIDPDSAVAIRYSFERGTPAARVGAGPRPVFHPDIVGRVAVLYNAAGAVAGVINNNAQVEPEARRRIEDEMLNIQVHTSLDYEWPFLVPVGLDGLTNQVTWKVGPRGATTRVSQNNEHDLTVPGLRERRQIEAVNNIARLGRRAAT